MGKRTRAENRGSDCSLDVIGTTVATPLSIALRVLSRNIDTSTPEGRLFFHMTAAFDEFQRELIVENTRAGLKAANRRGRWGGRPKAMDERTLKHAEAMLKDTGNYPFVDDVIDQLRIGRTAFHRYFPPDRIRQLRNEHADAIRQ